MKTVDKNYGSWLDEIKFRISQSQIKAALSVNKELLRLYWDLGCDIFCAKWTRAGQSII
jgi:hypothetical protein